MAMARLCCAQNWFHDARHWAMVNFGTADLGDKRRTGRLVRLAAAVMENPPMSLPKQLPGWSDLIGAYRLLSNDRVDPQQILKPHVTRTRDQAAGHPVVLCVQDKTQLDFTCRTGTSGLGVIGNGQGRGLLQHAALAVLPDKTLLGVLDVRWHALPGNWSEQKRRQRQARWTAADVWQEAAGQIGHWPAGSRLVHVGDRESDIFRFIASAMGLGHDLVLRSRFDRKVDAEGARLWETLAKQSPLGTMQVTLGVQRDQGNKIQRAGREATLTLRVAPIVVPAPVNDPRTQDAKPLSLWAVYLLEENPPGGKGGQEAVEWMLITSLPVETLEQAQRVIGYYTCRWVIEEWHRCLKEGCRVEASQLDAAGDIQRLTAILAVAAARLLQMRDLAESAQDQAESAQEMAATLPALWMLIVAKLAGTKPASLTPRQFWRTIARRGGYLGRKHDRRPGWKVIWRGWSDLVQMVRGAEIYQELLDARK